MGFVMRNETQFVVDGKVFYVNGWNSYWLMDHSVDFSSRFKVREMMKIGAKMGLTVCRTWAFNDGHYNALQISPGHFDEQVFQGGKTLCLRYCSVILFACAALDYVIAEARQNGIRLLLSLVNNLQPYGGKSMYVKWAWQDGVGLSSSNDSFFYDPSIRSYFKNYIKTVLTRKNTITGIEYRNDPAIFGWELINEPRCMTDRSGDTLQEWIEEMSAFVKLIDKKHMLTIGNEGFYGPNDPKDLTVNPNYWASKLGFHEDEKAIETQLKFISKWMLSHIEDGDQVLKKPVLFSEYGLSKKNQDFTVSARENMYDTILNIVYKSAKRNRSGAGSLVWQFLASGMEDYSDDYGIFPSESPSIQSLFIKHSCKLAKLKGWTQQDVNFKALC
ncbi:hypothetical protein TSUD_104570 [Trifolium subterraneum]|uniref:mannan endo-1,4-beta-mannosidase n=1 Tax=Trifolium subterraneum TaxID=3900 RepID=A0A2Z6M703_TRISU|nr:hypothetical protein TSUD_104570 [Trifolium subterraneum]